MAQPPLSKQPPKLLHLPYARRSVCTLPSLATVLHAHLLQTLDCANASPLLQLPQVAGYCRLCQSEEERNLLRREQRVGVEHEQQIAETIAHRKPQESCDLAFRGQLARLKRKCLETFLVVPTHDGPSWRNGVGLRINEIGKDPWWHCCI